MSSLLLPQNKIKVLFRIYKYKKNLILDTYRGEKPLDKSTYVLGTHTFIICSNIYGTVYKHLTPTDYELFINSKPKL